MGTDELVNNPERHRGPVEGVVAKPVPESVDDPLYVTVIGLDDRDHPEGPCPWTPRVDDTGAPVMPEEGNVCAVDYTDAGTPWARYWPDKEYPHD